MNLAELEAFKLSDAVRFHDELNPALWIDDKLDPEVKNQLLLIAQDFVSYLGIKDLDVDDVRISGSNAAYSWTEHSDLDLHVLVDMSKLPNNEVYRELFQAKKTLYNDEHDITVHDVPIELYVQDINQPHVSLGEYSLLSDSWIRIPKKQRANFDQAATKAKFEKLSHLVELALKSRDLDRVEKVINIIKRYRQAGLDKAGEFSPENLSFKALRTQGGIQDLYDLRSLLRSEKLSIEEVSNEDYDPNGPPPGPEFKPTMPKGTVRVDVSDVYDWYKLGQHISNMKGLGKHDFGKGPPSTILSFGDEDLEHQYIKALAKTGLDTTDIDPVDPKQPKGMKRQKTDPTFNVNESAVKNKLFVRQLSTENELIEHAKLFAKNLSLDGVPVTSKNRHTVVCSTIFAHNKKSLNESKHITSGKEAVQLLNRLDQFSKLPIKVGTKVAIINSQLQGDSLELWGFTTPKKISKIYRDPSDKSIKQFEFNNDPNDVWPRTENAEYNGHFLMYSAFFGDKKSADQALTMLMLQSSGDLEIRNHIVNEGASGYIPSNAEKNDPRYKTAFKIDEIGFSNEIGLLSMSDEQIIDNSAKDGTIGSRPVFLFVSGPNSIYFFANKSKIDALLYIHNGYLKGMKNFSKNKGLVYNLFQYLINIKKQKLHLASNDILTSDGIKWILDQLRRKETGFKIADQGGNEIDPNTLFAEWENARETGKPGPTAITIGESKNSTQIRENEKLLMPMDIYGATLTEVIPHKHSVVEVPDLIEASGYIPSNAEKNDPRYKTALTVDVKPNTMKRDAAKFGNKITRAGIPPQARSDGKIK